MISALTISSFALELPMWEQFYSITVNDLQPEMVWAVWSNVDNRPAWDEDTLWAKANGPFENGTTITFKPKGWPKTVSMKIIECTPNQSFTDHTTFFGCHLYGKHHMEVVADGLKLTTTITLKGPLTWLWRKIVGEDIVKTLPKQTDMLIRLARDH
jgi:hypothetical protein